MQACPLRGRERLVNLVANLHVRERERALRLFQKSALQKFLYGVGGRWRLLKGRVQRDQRRLAEVDLEYRSDLDEEIRLRYRASGVSDERSEPPSYL